MLLCIYKDSAGTNTRIPGNYCLGLCDRWVCNSGGQKEPDNCLLGETRKPLWGQGQRRDWNVAGFLPTARFNEDPERPWVPITVLSKGGKDGRAPSHRVHGAPSFCQCPDPRGIRSRGAVRGASDTPGFQRVPCHLQAERGTCALSLTPPSFLPVLSTGGL